MLIPIENECKDVYCHMFPVSCIKKRGRRWKKKGREEWRLRDDLGDLGEKGSLSGIYSIMMGNITN